MDSPDVVFSASSRLVTFGRFCLREGFRLLPALGGLSMQDGAFAQPFTATCGTNPFSLPDAHSTTPLTPCMFHFDRSSACHPYFLSSPSLGNIGPPPSAVVVGVVVGRYFSVRTSHDVSPHILFPRRRPLLLPFTPATVLFDSAPTTKAAAEFHFSVIAFSLPAPA